ncbi:SAF domain-containing protein, partial [Actinotalea sp. JY-7885]
VVVALAVARTAAPPPPATTPVVVVARDVAAGTVLDDDDVRLGGLPARCVPAGAGQDPADVVGRTVTVALPAGLPLVTGVMAGERFDVDPPDGTVVVPVHLATAVATTLRAGDRVDLVAARDTWGPSDDVTQDPAPPAPSVLAHGALVVEVRTAADADGGLGAGTAAADPTVLVAVPPDEGRALAADAGSALGAVLVG